MSKMTLWRFGGCPVPGRGDLIETALETKRQRTWFVLGTKRMSPAADGTPRVKLWIERWWDLDPATRMRLFKSAERRGGQVVIPTRRIPAKRKKQTFEQLMGGR